MQDKFNNFRERSNTPVSRRELEEFAQAERQRIMAQNEEILKSIQVGSIDLANLKSLALSSPGKTPRPPVTFG